MPGKRTTEEILNTLTKNEGKTNPVAERYFTALFIIFGPDGMNALIEAGYADPESFLQLYDECNGLPSVIAQKIGYRLK